AALAFLANLCLQSRNNQLHGAPIVRYRNAHAEQPLGNVRMMICVVVPSMRKTKVLMTNSWDRLKPRQITCKITIQEPSLCILPGEPGRLPDLRVFTSGIWRQDKTCQPAISGGRVYAELPTCMMMILCARNCPNTSTPPLYAVRRVSTPDG